MTSECRKHGCYVLLYHTPYSRKPEVDEMEKLHEKLKASLDIFKQQTFLQDTIDFMLIKVQIIKGFGRRIAAGSLI